MANGNIIITSFLQNGRCELCDYAFTGNNHYYKVVACEVW